MEKPAHILSFSMSYPQYRDYYLYRVSTGRHRPVWMTPELFLAAGILIAVVSLFCRTVFSIGFLLLFSTVTEVISILCVGAYFAVRLGWLFLIRRKARRQYRLDRLEKQKTQIRLYEDFFTFHYPASALDCFYKEIRSMDRTQRMTVLRLQNGAQVPIPNEQWTPQIAAFFMEKTQTKTTGPKF